MPTSQTDKTQNKSYLPTTRLASPAGALAQPPCTTTSYSPAQVPLNRSPYTQITLHTLSQTQSAPAPLVLSSLALEAKLGPTSATPRLAHGRW
jgi:hypothetical protein